jgi:hypothetical protein
MIFTSIKKVIRTGAFSSCYRLNFAALTEALDLCSTIAVKTQASRPINPQNINVLHAKGFPDF